MDDSNTNNIRQRLRPRRNTTTTTSGFTDTTTEVNHTVVSMSSSSSSTSSTKPSIQENDTHSMISNSHKSRPDHLSSTTSSSSGHCTIDATPPFHTMIVYSIMVLVLVYHLPTLQQIDEIATIQVLTQCQYFSSLSFISIYTIAMVRCICTVFITIVLLQMMYNRTGWYIITPYLKESKLMKHVQHHMIGIKTLYPFTSWSFVLLGLYFGLASYITLQAIEIQRSHEGTVTSTTTTLEEAYSIYNQTHRMLLRCTIVLWEISAPCTILVAVIVRYVMWPAALRRIQEEIKEQEKATTIAVNHTGTTKVPPPRPSHSLNSYQNICMHNINVALALFERCVWSGIPVRYNEWALAPLYGCIYVLFSWNMVYQYNDRTLYGPHFIYFFLDTTLPGYTCSYALLALLFVLLVFYSLYCSIESTLYYIDHAVVDPLLTITTSTATDYEWYYFMAHVLVVLFICSLVMRFRD